MRTRSFTLHSITDSHTQRQSSQITPASCACFVVAPHGLCRPHQRRGHVRLHRGGAQGQARTILDGSPIQYIQYGRSGFAG